MKTISTSIKNFILISILATQSVEPTFSQDSFGNDMEKSIIQRIQYLEEKTRQLNGKIEELEHKNYIIEKELADAREKGSPINSTAIISPTKKDTKQQEQETSTRDEDSNNTEKLNSSDDNAKQKRYNHAKDLLNATKYDYALKAFEDFTIDYPDDKLTITANFWIGEIHLISSDLKKAAIAYGKSYGKYKELLDKAIIKKGDFLKAPDALVKLALTFKNMKKFEDAKITLDQFDKEFKNAPLTIKKRAQIIKRQIKIVTG